MKLLFPFVITIFAFSVNDWDHVAPVTGNEQTYTSSRQDSVIWLDSYKAFRDAVYKQDKEKVKSFFDFPVTTTSNDIWQLIYAGNEKKLASLPEKPAALTETDFDKNYDRLFPRPFINTLMKLKSAVLFKTNRGESPMLKDSDSTTSYKMYGAFDTKQKTLTLHLYSESIIKDELDDNKVESSVLYIFSVIDKKYLKFKEIRIAG